MMSNTIHRYGVMPGGSHGQPHGETARTAAVRAMPDRPFCGGTASRPADPPQAGSVLDLRALCTDMNMVALLYTVVLATSETGADASELVRAAGAGTADSEAVAAAVAAVGHGRPVRAVARELANVVHADVDTFAAEVFRTYTHQPPAIATGPSGPCDDLTAAAFSGS